MVLKRISIKAGIFSACLCLAFPMMAMCKDVEDPSMEKIETIKDAKSDLYYCNDTDSYLIYSKKFGWFQITEKPDPDEVHVTVSVNGLNTDIEEEDDDSEEEDDDEDWL